MTDKQFITLERGKPYPLPIATQEGAVAQFLMESGSILQIILPGMTTEEQNVLRSGEIIGGFLAEGGNILWLFQFIGQDGQPFFTMDCPYDARLLGTDKLFMPDITNNLQRLAIEIHAVDEQSILRALRVVTLSPSMTVDFLSSVQDQLVVTKNNEWPARWARYRPDELLKMTNQEVLG